ncbi:hypothetical protein AC249_AIPGENE8934 [Exaiptasia diaphana]|nr:hypothetical protein AC249_AIPGENE8934 [Exaiptasia diaphana]
MHMTHLTIAFPYVTSDLCLSFQVNNKEYCPDKDGHNIVAFDYKSGKFLAAKNYDTHQNSGAGDLLEQFVTSLENDTLLLVAVKTSGHRISAKGLKALYKVGAKSLDAPPINTASVLVGLTGSLAEWIRETSAATPGELVATNIIIPLKKEIQPSHYWPLQKVDYYRKKQKNKHYYKHMRDVEGGMDIEYVHSMYIRMGLLIMRPHHMYTRTGWVPNSCFLKPSKSQKRENGGESSSLVPNGQNDRYKGSPKQEKRVACEEVHRTYIHFYSHNSGYISIEGKKRYMVDKGHHVILMDYATGKIRGEAIFKIPTDNTAEHRFAHFINTAPNGTIVLVNGWYKSYITSSDLIKALKSVGAREPQHNPTSISNQIYMLVGYKGLDKMKWIEEAKHNYVTSGTLRVRIPTFGGIC